MTLAIFLTVLSLVITVFSQYIHENFIDRFRFKLNKGRKVAGTYFAAWYTNTADPPVTWEDAIITQKGRKIRYQCKNNNCGFDYEMTGTIEDDTIVGRWVSKLSGEKVHGGTTLRLTTRGHIVGLWIGDSKMNNFTWGYWAISKKKEALETFVKNMQTKVKFRGVDLVKLFDEH
jgi:hypothetical protein